MVSEKFEKLVERWTGAPCEDDMMSELTDSYNWPCQEGCEEAMAPEWSPEERAIAQALTDCYNC